MLLFKWLEDCFFLLLITLLLTIPNNPINNDNNRGERNSHTKYFFQRVNITNYNILIGGRSFYDQPINELVKQ